MDNIILLNAGYAADDDRWNFSHVSSIFFRIYYVTEGHATVHFPTHDMRLQAGHLYMIPALATHDEQSRSTFRHYYIHFMDRDNSLIQMAYDYETVLGVKATERDRTLFLRLLELYPDLSLPTPRPDVYDTPPTTLAAARRFASASLPCRLEAQGIIMQLMARFVQARKRYDISDRRIRDAVVWIEQHLGKAITVNELAEAAALGKERFIRLFHHETGQTPNAYITQRRIFRAMLMLGRCGDKRKCIKEVAYDLGFANTSYFSRVFRKVAGTSPHEFAKANS